MLFYLIILIYASYRAIRGNIRTFCSINWVFSEQKKINNHKGTTITNNNKYCILIPVLREQEVIFNAFKTFSSIKGDFELIFITTQKEDYEEKIKYQKLLLLKEELLNAKNESSFLELTSGYFPQTQAKNLFKQLNSKENTDDQWNLILEEFKSKKHTRELIKELIKNSNTKNVRIIDYPYTDGVMAHQLNYACKILTRENDSSKTFVLVYNADSNISTDLIYFIEKYLDFYPEAKVIQQSSLFTSNFNDFPHEPKGYFLQSIALLQNRWTLAHELPRILTQFSSKSGSFLEGAHVVGHGLCVRLDILQKVGNFPTASINEDLPLGYLLRLHGEIIYPLPLFENSQSPTTVKGMFTQYKTWFYGLLYYPSYIFNALSDSSLPRLKAILWGSKYIIRAVLWYFSSLVWLFLMIYPIIIKNPTLLLVSLAVFIIYGPINFWIMINLINKNRKELFHNNYPEIKAPFQTYLMTLPAYLTHSVGPFWSVSDYLKKLILKKEIIKNKTER